MMGAGDLSPRNGLASSSSATAWERVRRSLKSYVDLTCCVLFTSRSVVEARNAAHPVRKRLRTNRALDMVPSEVGGYAVHNGAGLLG